MFCLQTVGTPLHGLRGSTQRSVLETFFIHCALLICFLFVVVCLFCCCCVCFVVVVVVAVIFVSKNKNMCLGSGEWVVCFGFF